MDTLPSPIVALRPFLPAKDFDQSLRFYQALGFKASPIGDKLAHLQLGPHAFLLQDFYVREFAENLMMHLMVSDLDSWWRHIRGLALDEMFGVAAPRPPKLEPWGLRVSYLWDPVGVLWHIAAEG